MAQPASTSPPHVACVLTTRDRPSFVAQAVRYFLRQDYGNRSLIVIDDGAAPAEASLQAMTSDPRLRYVRLNPGRRSRGEKRNRGCTLAPDGALIAHWDDDDWIAPDRLSRQVHALIDNASDLCAGRGVLYFQPATGRSWRERAALCAPTLLYRKSLWERAPLADRDGGEEQALVAAVSPGNVVAIENPDFYVVVLHDGNTIGRNTADITRWDPVPVQETIAPLLNGDAPFYLGLRERRRQARNGGAGVLDRRSSPQAKSLGDPATTSSITLAAPFMVYDGYGSMAEHLALGLERAGARVNLRPLMIDLNGTDPAFREIAARSRPDPRAPLLFFCWPSAHLDSLLPAPGGLIINTMWEGSRLPEGWAERINRARAVIVPTSFVADVFRASGVTVPVTVIPEGIDPTLYGYVDRPARSGLTTLMVGPVALRKNTVQGIAAWKDAFADDPEARLLLKARFRTSRYVPDDPRITLVDEEEPTRGIAHWYAQADVLLALGSEGFGLPLVEGMATGLPVIALDAAGQADTVRAAGPECLIPIPAAEWVPYDPDTFGHGGERPVPDIQAVADGLRWVAGHRDDALALGRAAADWARRERDIRHKAPAVLDLMEEVVSPHTPLRRVPTLWTPSRGKACGVAEYAEHLASGLATHEGTTPARHIARPPDGHGMSVLHIQHEWGLFPDDAALTARVRAAKERGVPVVVTQHTVRVNGVPHHPWQREADALVTLTESGAHRLRSQLPGRRVEWIPPGCPEHVPPLKGIRGGVIGGFGFLFPQKGFGKLLDLLRARSLPNLELLLLSHTRDTVSEAAWERDAADLPVRRVRDFLPVEEIVHRLATEADILVFWYDAISVESASYAARIGLATGVPMLCSPTPWFHDLREVTYQPAGATDADLREGVARLLTDDVLRSRLTEASRDYCHRHRWAEIARQHRVLWSQLAAA